MAYQGTNMANKQCSGTFTFHAAAGQQVADIDASLLAKGETISAREGYSAQESQFLKYLASKGHSGGTA